MKKYLGAMIILVAVLTGCGKKELSVDDFSTIKVGMSQKEVKKELGSPSDISEDLDNERVFNNLAPFKADVLDWLSASGNGELVAQLTTTIAEVEDGAEVTYYTYDYPSKKEKGAETATSIVFCDDKVSLILNDEEIDGLYEFD